MTVLSTFRFLFLTIEKKLERQILCRSVFILKSLFRSFSSVSFLPYDQKEVKNHRSRVREPRGTSFSNCAPFTVISRSCLFGEPSSFSKTKPVPQAGTTRLEFHSNGRKPAEGLPPGGSFLVRHHCQDPISRKVRDACKYGGSHFALTNRKRPWNPLLPRHEHEQRRAYGCLSRRPVSCVSSRCLPIAGATGLD